VGLTYDGSETAPVNAGSYQVIATVRDAKYEGSAGGTMTIAKAPQTITFNALSPRSYGDEMPFLLFAALSSVSRSPTAARIHLWQRSATAR